MSKSHRLSCISALLLIATNFACVAPVLAVDPIAVRLDPNGQAEFYHTGTQLKFIPRGTNFIRVNLASLIDHHATFNLDRYDPQVAENALRLMESAGYNIVRVFVSVEGLGLEVGEVGVNQEYMGNLIDFLQRAAAHNVYVKLTNGGGIPTNYFHGVVERIPYPDNVEAENLLIFHDGHINAFRRLAKDILQSIRDADPELLNIIFSFDLWNEMYFVWDYKPWTMESGMFRFLGVDYDMSSPEARQRLADRAVRQWANRVAAAVKAVSPNTLVTISLFTPLAVGRTGFDGLAEGAFPQERRVPARPRALFTSTLDYLDVHVYPHGSEYNLNGDMRSAEVNRLRTTKPLVMGEYGAFKFAFSTIESAKQGMTELLVDSCRFGFDGWLLWTWDTRHPDAWYARETSNGTNLNKAIAPRFMPQVCP